MCRASALAAAGPTAPDVHSEVTAAVPNVINPIPLPAGLFTGIGYGKLIGMTQLVELGTLEIPVVLTYPVRCSPGGASMPLAVAHWTTGLRPATGSARVT
ncbi:P1 family peptidase [Streptomyces sp. NPDC001698]|uniref:P1 family peptidase n=1 Tax=unclassified Streptomyces TaxID=2593676 RepID=UPI00368AA2C5